MTLEYFDLSFRYHASMYELEKILLCVYKKNYYMKHTIGLPSRLN